MLVSSKLQSSLKVNSEEVKPGIKGLVYWPVPSLFPGFPVQQMQSGHIRHCGHFWIQHRGSENRDIEILTLTSKFVKSHSSIPRGIESLLKAPVCCRLRYYMVAALLRRISSSPGWLNQLHPGISVLQLNRGSGEGVEGFKAAWS